MAGPAPHRSLSRLRNPRAEYYAWKMEETEKLIDEIRKQSEAGVPIIVEGRRDEAALRKLGITGSVYGLKSRGESRHEFLDRLNGTKEAIVLADFDREGKELETWLYKELSQRGVKSDLKLWIRMRSLARTEVRSVEEIPKFVRALEARARGIRSVNPQVPRA